MVAAATVVVAALSHVLFPRAAPPPCQWQGAPLPLADAGCLTIVRGRVLVIRAWDGRMALPGGTAIARETAQCTAHRETWEETGYPVAVQALYQRFDNGFHLFHCALVDSAPAGQNAGAEWPLAPRPFSIEVRSVHWLKAAQLKDYPWRFPAQMTLLEAALNATE